MLVEYIVLPEQAAIPFPPSLSYEEAACLPNAGVTAWHALVEAGQIKAGQTVLLLGTGGVSLFALQFAKMHSASVIQTSSSDEKLERASAMGADYRINYETTKDWSDEVLNLTDGRGVDVVVEVGGAHTLEHSLRAVRFGGAIALIGLVSGFGKIDPLPLMKRSIRLVGINVGSADMFRAMNRAIVASHLHPVISKVFPFEHATYAPWFTQKTGLFTALSFLNTTKYPPIGRTHSDDFHPAGFRTRHDAPSPNIFLQAISIQAFSQAPGRLWL
jgi:NADPH:quinone reductase-like Zn-dependent oxidoreductase